MLLFEFSYKVNKASENEFCDYRETYVIAKDIAQAIQVFNEKNPGVFISTINVIYNVISA